MNPSATLRLRRATAALAIGWAVLCLLIGIRAHLLEVSSPAMPFNSSGLAGRQVLQEVMPEALAAGFEPGDELLAVDGEPVTWWIRRGPPLELGRSNRYVVEKQDGRVLELEAEPLLPDEGRLLVDRSIALGIGVVGIVYLAFGLGVWWLRRDRPESWCFLIFCSVMAAQLLLAGYLESLSALVSWANVPLIGAASFTLFTTYPYEPAWVLRFPRIRGGFWLAAAALFGLTVAEPWVGLPAGLLPVVGFFFAIAVSLLSFAVVAHERWLRQGDPDSDRSTVMILGAVVSFVPVFVVMIAQYLLRTPYPWYASLLAFFIFPAAVGWGIVRNQLFDIRGVAKSSAAYGAVTLAITGLFAFLITFADAVVGRFNVNARSPAFSVAFLFLAILLFNPIRSRVQLLVDRFFDRDRAAYRSAVREISEAMVSMLSVKEIVDRILVAVTDTMGVEGGLVLLLDEDDQVLRVAASRGDWDEEATRAELGGDHPLCKYLWMRREELSRADFDREDDPELREAGRDIFDLLGAELLVPILYGVDLLGVIAVARKLSGEGLGADDRQLLRTLANQSSIAIENAKAFDEIAKLNETLEARVEERTLELRQTQAQLMQSEKMRSLGQLVAGVAHELNNPIGFVHANLQLLEETIGRLQGGEQGPEQRAKSREKIQKLLARSREGTERVKQIVQDLRTFSRTDQAELQEVDLNEEIERTLGLMEPRFKGEVTVERDFGELPRVRCYVGQLNQVFMNLVLNACDALEGRGTVRIRSRRLGDGVRVEISDDGPGLPPEVKERIFEPFFTTKPVGEGTGLGLSISHGIVERHGGRMGVESEPGHGATFWVELPREARSEA
ncbi:MAG: ATP-binding protein [Myxococcota bacterium]|nr:ATP-binding protein [Myxococcota bacterium]